MSRHTIDTMFALSCTLARGVKNSRGVEFNQEITWVTQSTAMNVILVVDHSSSKLHSKDMRNWSTNMISNPKGKKITDTNVFTVERNS